MNRWMDLTPPCCSVWVAPGKGQSTIWFSVLDDLSFLFPYPPACENVFPLGKDPVLFCTYIFHHVEDVAVKIVEDAFQLLHLFAVDHRFDDIHLIGRSFTMRERCSEIKLVEPLHQLSALLLRIDPA